MAEHFHYPPEVFNLLVDTIPLLCRSKKDVVLFLQGAGVVQDDLAEVSAIIRTNSSSINKFEITRNVLTKLNSRQDSGLRARREIIKRVTEFEDYSTCWPNDQLKAKGLVATLRSTVNVKDSFTRMKQERDTEREEALTRTRELQVASTRKRENIKDVEKRLSSLFGMNNQPQQRGKALEKVLNDLFRIYGIHVREDFLRKDPDSSVVLEQIDGVIELNGVIHLVEMKWLKEPVGIAEFSPHLVRLFGRANANGVFISTSDYTEPVIRECTTVLNQRTMFLCSLREIVMLLQRQGDLTLFLQKKSRAAIIEKNPYLEILS